MKMPDPIYIIDSGRHGFAHIVTAFTDLEELQTWWQENASIHMTIWAVEQGEENLFPMDEPWMDRMPYGTKN